MITLVAVTIAEGNVVAETIVNVVFDSKQNACPQQMALCEGATFGVKSQTWDYGVHTFFYSDISEPCTASIYLIPCVQYTTTNAAENLHREQFQFLYR